MIRSSAALRIINKYQLPVPQDKLIRIDSSPSPAHVGGPENTIDFLVAEITPI
jgi:hypothetical protein